MDSFTRDSVRAMMCILLTLCLGAAAIASQDASEGESVQVLTNAEVLSMHSLGLNDAVIIAKIRASQCSFDVSMDGMREVHDAGVSDDVLAEMIRVMTPATTTDEPDPNDPASIHPSGIYLYDPAQSPERMIKLEPTVYSQTKTGGLFKTAITYGAAKAKTRAVLRGAHAQLRITESKPEFYFYFSRNDQGLDTSGYHFFSYASSPNEFALVRLAPGTKKKDKDTRQLVIGKFSAWGATGGVLDESVVPFTFEKLRDGVYKVVPESSLEPGEYCFFYAASVPAGSGYTGPIGGGKVYDFGVASDGGD
jgi:hypothetical protein